MKVSVIIPIYNMEKYLRRSLDSVLGQTLKEIEIICIDDGSTDGSIGILEEYSNKNDNVVILQGNHSGAGIARNLGISKATGEYIAFLDADDVYPSNEVLELLYSNAIKNNVQMAGGSMRRNVNGKITRTNRYEFLNNEVLSIEEYQDCYGYTRFIFERSMLFSNNIFFPDYKRNQDTVFMLKSMIAAKRFWVTSEYTYENYETDKKINYSSEHVISDVISAIYDMMKMSFDNKLYDTQKLLMEGIFNKYYEYLLGHIYKGNKYIVSKLKDIEDCILDKSSQTEYKKKIQNIHFDINERIIGLRELKRKIALNDNIIIYGAGIYGKAFFDYLSKSFPGVNVLGFAISKEPEDKLIRGLPVKKIDNYADDVNNALLVIATNKTSNIEMKDNAKRLGFDNIIIVDKPIIDIENFVVTDKLFAYD